MINITNEQKAKEIAEYLNQPNGSNSLLECYQAAMAMAEWKDKQMIQWLEKHAGIYQRFDVAENRFFYNYTEMINDFKKAMKGK